jgi:hypothetical protein
MALKEKSWYDKITQFGSPLVLPWYPWFWFRNDETRLRELGARWLWINAPGLRAKTVLVIKSLVWPFVALVAHLLDWFIYGREVKRVFKAGLLSQLFKRMCFLVWRGYGSVTGCLFYFYEYGKYSNYDRFLSGMEVGLLNLAAVHQVDSEEVDNKLRFYLRCQELGIAMVPVFGVFDKGAISDSVTFTGLAREDLYLKLAEGMAGNNIERWKWSETNQHWTCIDKSLDETSLLDHCKALSETGTYILQPSAKHHPYFDPITEGGTCTLRVLTICSVDKQVEVVHNYVIIPAGDSPINHGPKGGLKAKMNLETHCFENLIWTNPDIGVSPTHPVTGEMVYGKRFDFWPEVEAFVKAAHLQFSDCFSIAWDLVYTPDGVQILEGNTQWGLINGCFIGESKYPQWIIEKLKVDAEKHTLLKQLTQGL